MSLFLNDKERFILLAFVAYLETGSTEGQVLLDTMERHGKIVYTPRCVNKEGHIGMDILLSKGGRDELTEFENILEKATLE